MRSVFRFSSVAILVASVFFAAAPVQAKMALTADDASKYVQSLADQALVTISDKTLTKEKKQDKLNKIFADNIDFNWVGRFVMGRYWRQATDDQKTRYLKEYQNFIILHYTSRFVEYTGGKFKITSTRDDGDGEFTVSMQMQSENDKGAEPVLVDYRVRKADKGAFKIFDVIVEGVSMLATQRSEFGSVIANNGIDHLIELLAAKSAATVADNASKLSSR